MHREAPLLPASRLLCCVHVTWRASSVWSISELLQPLFPPPCRTPHPTLLLPINTWSPVSSQTPLSQEKSVSLLDVSNSLGSCGMKPTRLPGPQDFPDKNTGVGSHFLLQGIFLTQGSKTGFLLSYHLCLFSSLISNTTVFFFFRFFKI